MAKDIIDKFLDKYIFTPEWMGRRGEKLTERELKLVRFLGRDGKILRNVYHNSARKPLPTKSVVG